MKGKALFSKIRIVLVFLLIVAMTFFPKALFFDPLPAVGASSEDITVSGLSSGGFMAGQFQVAFSSKVSGVGIFSAGPYLCAMGNLGSAVSKCSSSANDLKESDIQDLVHETNQLADSGKIDSPKFLKDHKVYIFHGEKDPTVKIEVAHKTQLFYELLGVNKGNINLKTIKDAGHAFPTEKFGNLCAADTEPPWMGACNYDGAYQMLSHLYEGIMPASKDLNAKGKLLAFNQTEFFDNSLNSMADKGYVYIPAGCQKERCKIHIFFHGCQQGYGVVPQDRKNDMPEYDKPPYKKIGKTLVENLGFNEIAEANNIIVLYPQLKKSTIPFNPRSCWDFWGYVDNDDLKYATKNGEQLSTIYRMVKRLTESKK